MDNGNFGVGFFKNRLKILQLFLKKRKWLFLSLEELEKKQLIQLKKLLLNFSDNRYYGKILRNSKLGLDDIRSANSLDKILPFLPILKKSEVQTHSELMINARAVGVFNDSSGGSTGHPVNFVHDHNWLVNTGASVLANDIMQGWFFFSRHAKIWGAPKDLTELDSPMGRLLTRLRKRKFYDSFNMSAANMWKWHKEMETFRPKLIFAYASSVFGFGEFLDANGVKPHYPTKAIICTAERLDDHMRNRLHKIFGVPVFDRYGSREVGCIAGECAQHEGLHLHMYDHIVECLDTRTGEPVWEKPGEIVVTDLNNYAFPFIRYLIGDRGILSKEACPCGRKGYVLRKIVGRTTDTITTKDGRLVHGEYFTHAFYGIEGITRFQFIQEDLEKYSLVLVRDETFREEALEGIVREIKAKVGQDSEVEIRFVDDIPITESGKFRFTVSKVPFTIGESGLHS